MVLGWGGVEGGGRRARRTPGLEEKGGEGSFRFSVGETTIEEEGGVVQSFCRGRCKGCGPVTVE